MEDEREHPAKQWTPPSVYRCCSDYSPFEPRERHQGHRSGQAICCVQSQSASAQAEEDDPIYLDRHTPKGDAIAPGLDFKDPNFPWAEIVKIPTQYSVSIFPHLSRLKLTKLTKPRTT
jgi:hypothetical protein